MNSSPLSGLWDGWSPPAELYRSRPRNTALTRAGIGFYLLAGFVVLFGIGVSIALAVSSKHTEAEVRLLNAEGATTPGVVTRLWVTGGNDSENWAEYRFDVNDRDYSNSVTMSQSLWKTLQTGSPIDIRYLPSDPANHSYPAADPPRPAPAWLPVLFAVSFIGAAFVFPAIVRRARRLLEDGQPAPARVTKNRKYKNQNTVYYEFSVQGQGTFRGRCKHRYVPEGTVICILHDPENPKRNTSYPPRWVRLAD